MKKFFTAAFLFLLISKINTTNAQVGIGVSTSNVNSSAQLEVLSTTKGFLPPRMTTSQRDAINSGNPAEGLVIFNTTKNCMQYKSDTGWVSVIPSTGTSTPINANAESVTIGSQIWSTKNLSVDRYRNGDIIPNVTSYDTWQNLTTGAWCWYNNDSANYAATYGRLYNFYAVNDPRGLAPTGWHIPTDAEWITLTTALGGTSVAGGAMKSTFGWIAPNRGATNSSGFEGLSGGERGINSVNYLLIGGQFQGIGSYCNWWSSTGYTDPSFSSYAVFRRLYQLDTEISGGGSKKHVGFSVRCVKN